MWSASFLGCLLHTEKYNSSLSWDFRNSVWFWLDAEQLQMFIVYLITISHCKSQGTLLLHGQNKKSLQSFSRLWFSACSQKTYIDFNFAIVINVCMTLRAISCVCKAFLRIQSKSLITCTRVLFSNTTLFPAGFCTQWHLFTIFKLKYLLEFRFVPLNTKICVFKFGAIINNDCLC